MKPIPASIRDHIAYDPLTGVFTWLTAKSRAVHAGDVAGSVHQQGTRWRIAFNGSEYGAHRIAWFLMTGEQPPPVIDHADLNPLNNRWSNLRAANYSLNAANVRSRRKGAKGVTLHPTGRFQAQIKRGGKNHYLGLFDTEEEAGRAYAAKATELFGEFARAA